MAVNIHESAEDYLESIYILLQKNGAVRSIDVVNDLGVSKPSVSVAMKKLRENGYIAMAADGHIPLLPRGEAIARSVYERHELLTRLFVELGVPEDIAAADACKVEHVLSEETFACIKAHGLGLPRKDCPGAAGAVPCRLKTPKPPYDPVIRRFFCPAKAHAGPW